MRRIYLGSGLGGGKLRAALRDLGSDALACTGTGEHVWAYIRREGPTAWHVHCGLPADAHEDSLTPPCMVEGVDEWQAGLVAAFRLRGDEAEAAACIRWLFAEVLNAAELDTIRLTIE